MKKQIISTLVLMALLLSACGAPVPPVQPTQTPVPTLAPTQAVVETNGLPPAEIANDEGGPTVVTGTWAYTSVYVARHFTEPVAMLVNISRIIGGNYFDWVPRSGEILGSLTHGLLKVENKRNRPINKSANLR